MYVVFLCILAIFVHYPQFYNGDLVVECLPPVRKVVGSNPRPGQTKDIKSGT